MADNDTAKVGQHWDITLSVPDAAGNEVVTDGPIVWTSSNGTVIMARDISPDGKTGKLEVILESEKDADGNPIPVLVTFVCDGDPGGGVRTLSAQTIPLFAIANDTGVGTAIVINMGVPVDSGVVATPVG